MKINPIVGATVGAVGAVLIAKHAFKASGTLPMILVGVGGALLGNHFAQKSQTSAFNEINDRIVRAGRSNAYGGVSVEWNPTVGGLMPTGVITNEESSASQFDIDLGDMPMELDI
jgi:uncharacterized membrane protein YeaQ/YmgE (transglycosylase-associated protein family)